MNENPDTGNANPPAVAPPTVAPPVPVAPPLPLPYSTRTSEPFISGHTFAAWTVALLWVGAALDAISILSDVGQAQLLQRVAAGETMSAADASASDQRQMVVGILQLAEFVLTAVFFLLWLRRAYRNLRPLGARNLAYSPGWAVGAWFVPILSLFRPYQIVRETWARSDPLARPEEEPRAPALLGWWWGLWIGGGVIGQVSSRMSLRSRDPETLLFATWFGAAGNLVSIGAAVLLVRIVRGIDAAQAQKSRLPQAVGVPTAPYVARQGVPPAGAALPDEL